MIKRSAPPRPGARRRRLGVLTVLTLAIGMGLGAGVGAAPGQAAVAATATGSVRQPVRTCESLAQVTFSDGTRVTSAAQTDTAPAICNVTLVVPQSTGIFMALPVDNWNGRFHGTGAGAYGGWLSPEQVAAPARAGYASAGTDGGHTGSPLDGSWAWSPTGMNTSLINDYAYRSAHEMTVKGKAITAAYYGRTPAYSYWDSCSGGGRMGLMEAQRYPDDYDGILAAAPALNGDRFVPAGMWPQVVMREAGDFVPQCKFEAFTQAAVAACDARDGVTDGVIDPRTCAYDPARLIGRQTPCGRITAKDATVMQRIWDGPRRPDGTRLWYGVPQGAPLNGYAVTTDTDGVPNPLPGDWFKYWLAKDPNWDWHTLTTANFATYFEQSRREYGDVLGTDDPDLSAFRDSAGKLIMWHGLADPVIMPQGTVDYYKRLLATMGGTTKTERFARLFMAPGVEHCIGGAGALPSDPLADLVKWVEHGQAPATLLAANGDTTRPLCRWPAAARYTGHGSTDDAANFRCSGR
ncbi:Tannase and feruloyl esterase [Streptomyces sp. yr375]|uniref:tannase/feruloyl esterase family alpha/beta hydrolase n=1 Tax=Streptomyces sp. yr375 TaxID=1761906 RepID=UPI0008D61004|nr:tannase/feruloyl esterase family alpha/beta hydrolase [Streptomyces sp. yr375]SER12248.1 Tannase and feruloyl esterase [Streptomyces sp. yr375]